MNYGDMKTRVKKLIGNRLGSNQVMTQDEWLETVFNDFIIPDFVGRHDWYFKETMLTGQQALGTYVFDVPDVIEDISLLILMTGSIGTTRPMEYMTQKEFFDQFPDPSQEASNFPSVYTWVNRQVWLNCPISDSFSFRMIGFTRYPRLVNDSDVPVWLRDDKHALLIYGATGFCFQTFEDAKNSQIWFNIFESGVETFWKTSEAKRDANDKLGNFKPLLSGRMGAYWENPFVRKDP